MTYLLDGKEISPADLAGKSGKLTIKIQYTNNTKQTVDVDGKEMEMSVPFMMVTGMMLDNDTCSNITVDNGMVENDGDHSVILCYGLPGLSDSLALESTDDFEAPEFPDTVEITADVTNFSMETAITVASAGLLNDLELDDTDTVEELEDSLNDLTDAAQQLLDGTQDLMDGVDELQDGAVQAPGRRISASGRRQSAGFRRRRSPERRFSAELPVHPPLQLPWARWWPASSLPIPGSQTLYSGLGTLQTGAATLSGGIDSAAAGAGNLAVGTAQLKTGAASLASGATQLQTGAAASRPGSAQYRMAQAPSAAPWAAWFPVQLSSRVAPSSSPTARIP